MNILDILKEKYTEEIGWRLNFSQMISFSVLLAASYLYLKSGSSGIWTQLLNMSMAELVLSENSILHNVRVLDFIIAGMLTWILSYINLRFAELVFKLFPKEILNKYIQELKKKHPSINENQAVGIYLSSQAKAQKDFLMKKLRFMRSSGIIFLTMLLTGIFGMNGGKIEFCVVIASFFAVIFMHIKAILFYISDVAPCIVAERVYRGLDVKFGDELKD